jgi:hypothetical protein
MGLAVALNNVFVWFLVIFVALPVILLTWFAVGTVLAMVMGPLGYIITLIMMLYFWRH